MGEKHNKPALSEQFVLRVTPMLRARIKLAAVAEGRSIASMTRRIIEAWANEQRQAYARKEPA